MWLTKIIEPMSLKVGWQGPEHISRTRWHIADLIKTKIGTHLVYRFGERDFIEATKIGFSGYPAFPIQTYNRPQNENIVWDIIQRRLPSRDRPDYSRYLSNFCISENVEISDFALLGYTEGKLPGDWFSFVHPFEGFNFECQLLIEVAGFRYNAGMDMRLNTEESVTFLSENNPHEPEGEAVAIYVRGQKIGFVNRLQRSKFLQWLNYNIVIGKIAGINGTFDRPRVMIFVEIFKKS